MMLHPLRVLPAALALNAVFPMTGPVAAQSMPVTGVQKQSDGVALTLMPGRLRLQVWSPTVIRVTYSPGPAFPTTRSLSVIAAPRPVPFRVTSSPQAVTLDTGSLRAQVSRATGTVRFLDESGKTILSEQPGGRAMTPVTLAGPTPEAAYRASQKFLLPAGEGIYGLGQHQQGDMDYRNSVVTLEQVNREVAIPFLVSSRGYGVLWDNPAHTEVGVGAGDEAAIPTSQLSDADGRPGGLTGQYYNGQDLTQLVTTRTDPGVDFRWADAPAPGVGRDSFSARWTGSVQAGAAGDYTFATTSDDGARLWVDGQPLIDDWSVHASHVATGTVHFAAGSRHAIRLEYFQAGGDARLTLAWRTPGMPSAVTWTSEAGEAVDYYFINGPTLDRVIASYRGLTGQAPMPPKWALGFFQSKERYATQQEWLDIAQGYRARREPLDAVVQDWYYWDPYPWGSDKFDPKRYPDPAAALATLHDQYHVHLMISVWGKFQPGTPQYPDLNYDAMRANGYLYPAAISDQPYYDAFNPHAGALYWDQVRDEIFAKGVDAWWLDGSEPEVNMEAFRAVPTARGLAARVLNGWPLEHTGNVYRGQRATTSAKRVFILTRSAYAGQQRNAAATWSGDITASWQTFQDQVPAGLNFCLSGIPYWTTDIGAFFVPGQAFPGGSSNPDYRELFTRWFEWGAFCPIFRVHGTDTPKELWRFGPDDEAILTKYDNLRYRLMPYLYSQAWQVTHDSGTIMRALVMDFPQDKAARESKDEFLFGPALLVAPVTQPGATSRAVYLPQGARWTDFWTGATQAGGQTITAPAPLDTLPLAVRAGSILPMGPYLQYASEKPADPLEMRVYRGADGTFTLYEDGGDGYDYEHGVYATIPITWDQAKHTLTIGARRGRFPGMLTRRTLQIVWVRPGHGVGLAPTPQPDAVVTYDGRPLSVRDEVGRTGQPRYAPSP